MCLTKGELFFNRFGLGGLGLEIWSVEGSNAKDSDSSDTLAVMCGMTMIMLVEYKVMIESW